MSITSSTVSQCRRNVVKNKKAWMPVSFSQYDPNHMCQNNQGKNNRYSKTDSNVEMEINEDTGSWRTYGYGMACMYKSDFLRSGGFDMRIVGWGEEDVRLCEALIAHHIEVFRSQEPSLIHLFHPKDCDPNMTPMQVENCRKTKYNHFASQRCLHQSYASFPSSLNNF